MPNVIKAKNYNDSFLYHKAEYGKEVFNFVMSAHRVNKDDVSFEEIMYEVKKQQVTPTLSTVLKSKNVILLIGPNPLPRSLKVLVGTDPKGDDKKAQKVFIDVSEIIHESDGYYKMNRKHGPVLIAYLMCAMNSLIYHVQPSRMVGNTAIVKHSTNIFAKMFTYVIDYLRLGGVAKIRETTLYLSAIYYQVNHLGYDKDSESVLTKAKNISGLTEIDITRINFAIDKCRNTMFTNIDGFVKGLAIALKIEKLPLDTIVNKWVFLFGSGTQFGLELYEGLINIICNAYVGSYMNNQNTIEKIVGVDMIELSKAIMKVGSDSM